MRDTKKVSEERERASFSHTNEVNGRIREDFIGISFAVFVFQKEKDRHNRIARKYQKGRRGRED
jgi:hypothetical protein